MKEARIWAETWRTLVLELLNNVKVYARDFEHPLSVRDSVSPFTMSESICPSAVGLDFVTCVLGGGAAW